MKTCKTCGKTEEETSDKHSAVCRKKEDFHFSDRSLSLVGDSVRFLTEHDLLNELTEYVEALGSQVFAALELEISVSYLNDILHGVRRIGPKVQKKLMVRRVVLYVR